jgi:hypothetical protein
MKTTDEWIKDLNYHHFLIKGIIDRLNGRTPLKNSLEERIAFLEMENRELNLKLSERGIE